MATQTRGNRPAIKGRPPSVAYDPDEVAQRVKASGLINPGEKEGQFTGPHISNPLKDIPAGLGKAMHWITSYDPWKKK